MPVKEGTKRVFVINNGTQRFEMTDRVTKVESKSGVYTVTLDSGSEKQPQLESFEVSDKGVYRLVKDGKPTVQLDLTKKEGEGWECEQPSGEKLNYARGKEEELEVPAGTYQAIRVDLVIKDKTTTGRYTLWYASGVGVVKTETDVSGQKMTCELQEFTPGK